MYEMQVHIAWWMTCTSLMYRYRVCEKLLLFFVKNPIFFVIIYFFIAHATLTLLVQIKYEQIRTVKFENE